MNAHRGIRRRTAPRGFSLIEGVLSAFILALSTIGAIQGLNYGYVVAKRAEHETKCEMRCLKLIEEVMVTPYAQISSNRYPTELATIYHSTSALTTWFCRVTVEETMLPSRFKKIDIYASWNVYGGKQRYNNYMVLRAPIEMRNPF